MRTIFIPLLSAGLVATSQIGATPPGTASVLIALATAALLTAFLATLLIHIYHRL